MIDLIGHIGYAFIAAGMFFLTKKNEVGWPLRFFGTLIWVVIGLELGLTSIWMWGIFSMVLDLKGYFNWRKENE